MQLKRSPVTWPAVAVGSDTGTNQCASFLLDQQPPSSLKSSATTTPSSPIRFVSATGGLLRFGRVRELANTITVIRVEDARLVIEFLNHNFVHV